VSKDRNGLCGVNPFCTNEDDPFIECCRAHDLAYDDLPYNESTKEIDVIFLECCLAVAKEDKPLRTRARIYYHLARNYGRGRYILGKLGILI
jgi:hypothetical protein